MQLAEWYFRQWIFYCLQISRTIQPRNYRFSIKFYSQNKLCSTPSVTFSSSASLLTATAYRVIKLVIFVLTNFTAPKRRVRKWRYNSWHSLYLHCMVARAQVYTPGYYTCEKSRCLGWHQTLSERSTKPANLCPNHKSNPIPPVQAAAQNLYGRRQFDYSSMTNTKSLGQKRNHSEASQDAFCFKQFPISHTHDVVWSQFCT
jgi:hypothetical protein